MALQTLQEILKSKIKNPSTLHRVDELREMGIEVEMIPIEQSRLLENLAGKLPRKILTDGIEYVAQMPDAKTFKDVATFEILEILPEDARLFSYSVPVRNPKYIDVPIPHPYN